MTSIDTNNARPRCSWIRILLFPFALLLLTAVPALAVDCVADRGGVIDGSVNPVAPAQIQIDGNCTIRNFPASNPLSTNFSFLTQPGQTDQRWLVIFDNVVHTGQMSCNAVHGHKIWFTNGSSTGIHANCQNLFIPVEKINKQNPAGQTTATIGVPFTYKLTIPVLFDPLTGAVINSTGSPNDLHGITIWDNLNATGASLSYVSHVAYWMNNGTPVPHTFSNNGGALTFDNFPIVTAGRQFVIEITVVLNNTPANAPGTQFRNTAKWDFGRLIDGVFYEPLPGEWGVTPPMTIAAPSTVPALVVTKSGPATMNLGLGHWGNFAIDVQNTGPSEAWDVTFRDLLPRGATGGMCDLRPEILSAQVFAADGVTPVPGKGPLNLGDYSLGYSAAPNCRLDVTMLTAAGRIGPNERLIIRYRTQLDANTQTGATLTNVAGAIQWFNDSSSNPNRNSSTRTLTNGTPGVLDHEDAYTVTAALSGYSFEKTVANLTSGVNPAITAAPGDKLRYSLRFRTNQGLINFRIFDDLDALNANPAFEPGTLMLVTTPTGADISATSTTGGTKGTGVIDIRNLSLPASSITSANLTSCVSCPAALGEVLIQFDITLKSAIANGTVVTNQSALRRADGTSFAVSDDPNVNGAANPLISGDEDPTRVTIGSTSTLPALVVNKSGPATMNLKQWGDFVIDVQNIGLSDAWDVTIRDLLPDGATGGMCDLTPEIFSAQVFAANGFTAVPGKGLLNSGSGYLMSYNAAPNCQLEIRMQTAAAAIGPNERLIIRYRTQLDANTQNGVALTNVAGAIQWFNGDSSNPSRQSYTRTLTNGTVSTPDHEDAHTVMGLTGYFFEKTAVNLTSGVNPTTTAAPGHTLRYTLRFRADEALSSFRIFDDLDALNAQPAFMPGTLTLVSSPPGGDISATSSTGGTKGTGVIDIRNLNLPAGGEVLIQFDVRLATTLTNGTVVTNQSALRRADGTAFAVSDDPNVNGTANPQVAGDEDPTRVRIVSAAAFRVQKISTDLTADPNVLLAGETLRYTITVKNIGNGDAVNVVLRDLIPANTTYVVGSTTLNGVPVPDSAGLSALVNGMRINSPANTTPGSMPADASSNQANVATITFDVVVNRNVVNGTVIANQGFVTALDSGIVDHPSDDPDTPVANDPTRDIVGNRPLLYAEKRVRLIVDLSSPGIVDPGDVLRYTITVRNSAAIPATGVVLRDTVPANTTYVANSTLLNGLPVGQPDGGVSPLASRIDITSSDLTPPLPGPGAGTISPGATAVLQFDLRVNAGTPAGTVISNQAMVNSVELPDLLTDGDGNPATGPEPTVVVVGNSQQLSITNQVVVVGGGAAVPGAQLEYVVRVVNIAAVPAINVVITDNLDASQPGQLAYVNGSATLNGVAQGVTFAGSTITANYAAISGPLQPGGALVLRFRAILSPGLVVGTVVTNTGVVAWNEPRQTAVASVSIVVGGVPGFTVLSGSTWHDADFDDARDSGERAMSGWTVDVYRNGQLVHSAQTDAAGVYRIIGVAPTGSGSAYELRFRAPGAGPNTAMLGLASSPFTNGMQRITDIVVPAGANLQGLNLPIHPNGVIYNSVARIPVAGATVTLLDAGSGSPLPAGCFNDAAQQRQITLADGYYKFDVNFSNPACPSGANYLIGVIAPPGSIYMAGYSRIIPPTSHASTTAFSVPACPASSNDSIPDTGLFCEVQRSEFAPTASVAPRSAGTIHHVHLRLDGSQTPGSSQIFNNHIPLDPQITGSLAISKTTPLLNVTRGQLVPYVITLNNPDGLMLTDVSIVDRFPAGFSYVQGSALLDGERTEPSVTGLELSWNGLAISGTQARTVRLLLVVGAGVTEGEYVNGAQAVDRATAAMSGEATATVRVIPDPTFDCTDVTGKAFNDVNRNGVQDHGEDGLPGVRVVTARGLQGTTDQYGRYHITCAITPHESRGSNFVLKLDDRTLPSGFRMSTDQVQIKRVTRGKAVSINFGASIHRVVGIDLSDAVFEPGTTEIRVHWRPRLNALLEELRKAPAVLRLSYVADTENAALVERRMKAIKRQLTEAWDAAKYSYALTIEPEVFWRRGAPPKRPDVRVPGKR